MTLYRLLSQLSKLAIALGLAGLLAACQTTSLGGEVKEVAEADQPLIFSGPGLEGGYRKFTAGDPDGSNHFRVTALYGAKAGMLPRAQFQYNSLRGGYHWTGRHSPQTTLGYWNSFDGENLKEVSSGRAVNGLGAADYAIMTYDDVHCISIVQFFGERTDAGYGTDRILGYYCAPAGVALNDQDAHDIVSRLGHRTEGVPKG